MRYFTVLLVFVITSCTCEQRLARLFEKCGSVDTITTHDTTLIIRDRPVEVQVPGDSIYVETPAWCDSITPVHVTTPTYSLDIELKPSRIAYDLELFPQVQTVYVTDTLWKFRTQTQTVTKIVEKKLTGWRRFWSNFGLFIAIGALLIIAFLIFRPRIPFL